MRSGRMYCPKIDFGADFAQILVDLWSNLGLQAAPRRPKERQKSVWIRLRKRDETPVNFRTPRGRVVGMSPEPPAVRF